MIALVRKWAKQLKSQITALYYAMQDARMPWYAKVLAAAVVAYALSPIDLIPDFIPVLGLLDDLLIVPVGIWLTLKLIPGEVWEDAMKKFVEQEAKRLPPSKLGLFVILAIWIAAAIVTYQLLT